MSLFSILNMQPVWLTRWCDDISSGWIVNRIPEFYT